MGHAQQPPQGGVQKKRHKRQKLDDAAVEKLIAAAKKNAKPSENVKTHVLPSQKQPETKPAHTAHTGQGRPYTVSIALPGSIVDNAQSAELRTYLAGQIGRALAVFNIDEVVIFRESDKANVSDQKKAPNGGHEYQSAHRISDSTLFLARVLQYLETPQYLRKAFFPVHKDLQYAGLLNPLDAPHHMRIDEVSPYREGVVLNRPVKENRGSFVDCGMRKQVIIDKRLQPGLRVTVKMDLARSSENAKHHRGVVVKPSMPREEAGLYWGYTVRVANTMADIFAECPYKDGYDVTLGTSERGEVVDSYDLPPFKCVPYKVP